MRKKVCWCATYLHEKRYRFLEFVNKFAPEEYKILAEEEDNFYTILEAYQKDLIYWFLTEGPYSNGPFTKKQVAVSDEEYFIITFQQFLMGSVCAQMISGNQMYEYIGQTNSYTTKYRMTDFAVVYHKAYLATSSFKKEKNMVHPRLDSIKEDIDKREMEIMRYFP